MIDYGPLWETLQKKGISQYQLVGQGIDKNTLDRLRKNKNITVFTVEKLCRILQCSPNDIFTIVPSVKEQLYTHTNKDNN